MEIRTNHPMKNTPAQTDPTLAPRKITLLEIIEQMNDKKIGRELQASHAEMTAAIMNKGGKGRITITFDYARSEDKGVIILADIVTKLPKKARRTEFVYADDRGNTFLDDPTEPELPFPAQKISVVKPAAVGQ